MTVLVPVRQSNRHACDRLMESAGQPMDTIAGLPSSPRGRARGGMSRAAIRYMNASWHQRHPMPKNPSLEMRIRWHIAHAQACGCRGIPQSILLEFRRRGISRIKRRR